MCVTVAATATNKYKLNMHLGECQSADYSPYYEVDIIADMQVFLLFPRFRLYLAETLKQILLSTESFNS